uniref:Uncharacterized protein n=1 Tax=Anguilla anguilla TaxID=7936 RepID=A0A0E9QNK0_ANGAN
MACTVGYMRYRLQSISQCGSEL